MSRSTIRSRPRCVDLTGALTRTVVLIEAVFTLLKRNPLHVLLLPFWLHRGKAALKQGLADRIELDVTLLPYNQPILDWIKVLSTQGKWLIPASASNRDYAEQVASQLALCRPGAAERFKDQPVR